MGNLQSPANTRPAAQHVGSQRSTSEQSLVHARGTVPDRAPAQPARVAVTDRVSAQPARVKRTIVEHPCATASVATPERVEQHISLQGPRSEDSLAQISMVASDRGHDSINPQAESPSMVVAAEEAAALHQMVAVEEEREAPDLLQQVTGVLAALEAKATPASSALARLRELSTTSSQAFPEVIGQCVDMVLSCSGPHLDTSMLDSMLDVIVAACAGVRAHDGTSLIVNTLRLLVHRFGDKDGAEAPRNKYARCYGARLLCRLLPLAVDDAWPEGLEQNCGGVLTRLSCDRAPAVRLASIPGLSAFRAAAAHAALVRLSVVDSSVAIRVAALKALASSHSFQSLGDAKLPLNRCLDAAPAVRHCLYTVLSKETQGEIGAISDEAFINLLRNGLNDVSASVRSAAEEMLCGWLAQRTGSTSPVLKLLSIIDVEADEEFAEKVISSLALRDEWRQIFWSIPREPPADYDDFRSERALMWRTMVMKPDIGPSRYVAEFGIETLVAQVNRSMQRGSTFEMRQLLLVLAGAGSHAHGESCCNSLGGCKLFEIAVSVLLQVPVVFQVRQNHPSAICLALVVLQNTLKGCRQVRRDIPVSCHGDARFLEVVASILSALRQPSVTIASILSKFMVSSTDSSSQTQSAAVRDGFDALGEKFDLLLKNGHASEEAGDEGDDEIAETSGALALITRRALAIAEEALGLLSTSHADDSLELLEDLPNVWFRPTLVRADMAESAADQQLPEWPSLRAIAVRCLALHTSLCPELCASHWPFFLLVLKRYSPLVVSSRDAGAIDGPTSSIVESCVHFLVDSQLVHRRMTDPADLDKRSTELFESVAGLLGLPARQMQLPPRFRHCLTERLCMLLLFGGVWNVDHCSTQATLVPAGALDTIPLPARWVLTGLLVEAFYRPPPVVGATGRTELALQDAMQEAAQRGCLLQFFSSLSDLSGLHATLLAAACEGLLATELWRLAVPVQLGCGRRWRALQLPRLLRLLSRHLVAAAGVDSVSGTADMMVKAWLECMWRPLALICLEAKQDQAQSRQLLAEALLATLAAIEVAGESRTPFAAAAEWPAAISEVAHVLSLITASWGWNLRRQRLRASEVATATEVAAKPCPAGCGYQVTWHATHCCQRCADDCRHGKHKHGAGHRHGKRCEKKLMTETLASSAPSQSRASAEPPLGENSSNSKEPLLKLAARFSAAASEHMLTVPETWPEAEARKRRHVLSRAFADLGVDTRGIVEAATEAVRVRPSRAFLSGSAKQKHRKSIAVAGTSKRARRFSKMAHKRRPRKSLLSDDDSDAPIAQKPRHESLNVESAVDVVDAECVPKEVRRNGTAWQARKKSAASERLPEDSEMKAQVKMQRTAIAFGF